LAGGRLRYWSSQRATGGIGVHEEEVGPGWQIHLVRATDDGRRPIGEVVP
jgi:hypothetical protein